MTADASSRVWRAAEFPANTAAAAISMDAALVGSEAAC